MKTVQNEVGMGNAEDFEDETTCHNDVVESKGILIKKSEEEKLPISKMYPDGIKNSFYNNLQ